MVQHLFLMLILLLISTNVSSNTRLSHDGYIIKYNNVSVLKSTTCKTQRCELLKSFKMEVVKSLPKSINKNSNIAYIEPNWIYHVLGTPSDPMLSKQWALKKIKAEKAWDLSLGSRDIVVAVIDTGVDYTHPDLKNQMWR